MSDLLQRSFSNAKYIFYIIVYLKTYLKTNIKKVIGRKRQVKAKRKDGSEFDVELGVQEVMIDEAENNGEKSRVFCGYTHDLTQTKKDKRTMIKQQQMINNKFFSG